MPRDRWISGSSPPPPLLDKRLIYAVFRRTPRPCPQLGPQIERRLGLDWRAASSRHVLRSAGRAPQKGGAVLSGTPGSPHGRGVQRPYSGTHLPPGLRTSCSPVAGSRGCLRASRIKGRTSVPTSSHPSSASTKPATTRGEFKLPLAPVGVRFDLEADRLALTASEISGRAQSDELAAQRRNALDLRFGALCRGLNCPVVRDERIEGLCRRITEPDPKNRSSGSCGVAPSSCWKTSRSDRSASPRGHVQE